MGTVTPQKQMVTPYVQMEGRVKQEISLVRASDSSLVLALRPLPAPGLGAENENKPRTVPREGRVR